MATQKPKIQGYIEQATFDRFEAYRQESNLSQSQALEKILASFFGGEQQGDLNDRFESLCQYVEQEFKKLQERIAMLEITSNLPSESLSNLPQITDESLEITSEQITSDLPSDSLEITSESLKLVVCKLYKNNAKDPQSWRYWAGAKAGFVEDLSKAKTYTEKGSSKVINQLLEDEIHKPTSRERISCRALEELRMFAANYEEVC